MRKNTLGRLFWIGMIFPIFLFALLLAACGSAESDAQSNPTDTPTATNIPMATAVNSQAQTLTDVVTTTVPVAAPAVPEIAGVEIFSGLTAIHNPGRITYTVSPPPGGDHNPAWMNCGVYTITLPNELAVHSLEHGAVWITYLPELPADQVEILKTLTKAADYRLLSPLAGQSNPIIATAWGFQLKLENASDPRLEQFILQYANRSDGPEFGAPCSEAYGEPEK